jgi:hypothetical protein
MTNVEIHQRLLPSQNGESTLKYFDGATMLSYRFPSKATERVFCLRDSKSGMCKESQTLSQEGSQLQAARLEAKPSGGRSVVTTVGISFADAEDAKTTRDKVINQYFSGENTYNPYAERHSRLYPNAIPTRKLR